jgi:uncharacterized delta-60 repeat protein
MNFDRIALGSAAWLALTSATMGCSSSPSSASSGLPDAGGDGSNHAVDSGDSGDSSLGKGSITMSAPTTPVELTAGGVATPLTIQATRATGAAGDITLTVSKLPSGVTAAPAVIPAGQSSGSIALTAAASAAPGAATITVAGALGGDTAMTSASLVVRGAPGTLDTTFGKAGLAFQAGSSAVDAVALQPDGKIILGAVNEDIATLSSTQTLSRISDTLVADTSFGNHGALTLVFGTGGWELPLKLFVLSSGDIVDVGAAYNQDETYEDALAARFTGARTLDTTFGNMGKSIITMPGPMPTYEGYDAQFGVLQSDGGIVVVGGVATDGAGPQLFERLTPAGVLDTTFGTGGFFEPSGSVGAANCGALQSDGNIVAAGFAAQGSQAVWQVERITPAGAYDTSYGTGGSTTTALTSDSYIEACALDAKGNLVVVGTDTVDGMQTFVFGRYTPAGIFDASFNHGIPLEVPLATGSQNTFATTLVFDSAGRIVGAGGSLTAPIIAVRVTSEGLLDPTFGNAGVLATSVGVTYDDTMVYRTSRGLIESDQRLWLVGTGQVGGTTGTFATRVWL